MKGTSLYENGVAFQAAGFTLGDFFFACVGKLSQRFLPTALAGHLAHRRNLQLQDWCSTIYNPGATHNDYRSNVVALADPETAFKIK